MSAAPKLRVFSDGESKPLSPQAEQSIKDRRRWQRAQRAVLKSESIDRGLKQFCTVFLGAAGSACRYELVWLSQTSLAHKLGYTVAKDGTCRTIKRYVALLRQIGAVTVMPMGMREARLHCFTKYGYKLANCSRQHQQNFYLIEYGHPFWTKGRLDEGLLVRTKQSWRKGTGAGPNPHFAPAPGRGDERASELRTGTPVSRSNRDTGVPQERLLERETDAASLPTQPEEDQAHPPTPDESGRADSSDSSSFVGHQLARHTRADVRRRLRPELVSHEESKLDSEQGGGSDSEGEELLAASCEETSRTGDLWSGFATPPVTLPTGLIGAGCSRISAGPDSRSKGDGEPRAVSSGLSLASRRVRASDEAEEPSEPESVSSGLPKASVVVSRRGLARLVRQELAALAGVAVPGFDED